MRKLLIEQERLLPLGVNVAKTTAEKEIYPLKAKHCLMRKLLVHLYFSIEKGKREIQREECTNIIYQDRELQRTYRAIIGLYKHTIEDFIE